MIQYSHNNIEHYLVKTVLVQFSFIRRLIWIYCNQMFVRHEFKLTRYVRLISLILNFSPPESNTSNSLRLYWTEKTTNAPYDINKIMHDVYWTDKGVTNKYKSLLGCLFPKNTSLILVSKWFVEPTIVYESYERTKSTWKWLYCETRRFERNI